MKTVSYSIFLIFYLIVIPFSYNCFAQDSPQWHLPVGATKRLGKGWLHEIQYSPDGTQLAAAGSLGVWIYDTNTDKEIALYPGEGWGITSLTYSPDGSTLTSGSADGIIRIWNTITGEIQQEIDAHWRSIRSLAFNSDGTILASASRDRTIRLWNPQTGELIHTLRGHID